MAGQTPSHRNGLTNNLPYSSFADTLLARRRVDFAAGLHRPNVGGKSGAITCGTFNLGPNVFRLMGSFFHGNHYFENGVLQTYHGWNKIELAGVRPGFVGYSTLSSNHRRSFCDSTIGFCCVSKFQIQPDLLPENKTLPC
jgi:hypothetical protein